jgi:isopenicillin N synthase-like dioxygenase
MHWPEVEGERVGFRSSDSLMDIPVIDITGLRSTQPSMRAAVAAQLGAACRGIGYGNITILATDGVAGLEVRSRGGRWIDAPAIAGALICNIGDCLMRWTNDVYVSTPHRVRVPNSERFSIAFFLDPNPDAIVEMLPGFAGSAGVAKYPAITGAAYLAARLNATYDHRQTSPS